jgi:hypothetical protein
MSQGTDFKIGMAFQNSGDTVASVTSLQWFEFTSESFGRNIPPLVSQGIRNVFDENDEIQGPNTVDGDFSIEARPIELGWILKAMCGVSSVTEVGSALEHTFQLEQSDWSGTFAKQPVTIHKGLGVGSAEQCYDLNCNILELSCVAGEHLIARSEFVGGQLSQIAEATPTFESGRRFAWDQSSISIADSAGVGQKMTELTITIDEKLEAMHTLRASQQPSRIHRTDFRSIEVSGTMKFDDQSEMQEYFNFSERPLVATFAGVTEIASGYVNKLEISIPNYKVREFKPEASGAGKVEVSFTGSAKYNTGSGSAVQFTLVNTQLTY